jgi:hypothetical protein
LTFSFGMSGLDGDHADTAFGVLGEGVGCWMRGRNGKAGDANNEVSHGEKPLVGFDFDFIFAWEGAPRTMRGGGPGLGGVL